jgi:hypothetical protein
MDGAFVIGDSSHEGDHWTVNAVLGPEAVAITPAYLIQVYTHPQADDTLLTYPEADQFLGFNAGLNDDAIRSAQGGHLVRHGVETLDRPFTDV